MSGVGGMLTWVACLRGWHASMGAMGDAPTWVVC